MSTARFGKYLAICMICIAAITYCCIMYYNVHSLKSFIKDYTETQYIVGFLPKTKKSIRVKINPLSVTISIRNINFMIYDQALLEIERIDFTKSIFQNLFKHHIIVDNINIIYKSQNEQNNQLYRCNNNIIINHKDSLTNITYDDLSIVYYDDTTKTWHPLIALNGNIYRNSKLDQSTLYSIKLQNRAHSDNQPKIKIDLELHTKENDPYYQTLMLRILEFNIGNSVNSLKIHGYASGEKLGTHDQSTTIDARIDIDNYKLMLKQLKTILTENQIKQILNAAEKKSMVKYIYILNHIINASQYKNTSPHFSIFIKQDRNMPIKINDIYLADLLI